MYIDMEGRSDDQSMHIMIEHMQPKRIAFVHGSRKQTKQFSNRLTSPNIYLTAPQHTIEMKSDTKTYSIKMGMLAYFGRYYFSFWLTTLISVF